MADVYLGRYEALKPLGRGSMGLVILAQVIGKPQERVVIKVMNDRTAREPRVRRLLGMLGHALDAAHHVGVVHRDLKPANLMVTDAGTPQESLRVMDFGLAQLTLKPHFSAERLAGAPITSAMGTPSYVCPEQLRGDEVDARADIYSVGVV